MLKVYWDRIGAVIAPVHPWPPCQELADVTDLDASRLLYEACCDVLHSRCTWHVQLEDRTGSVRIKVPVSKEQARAIAAEFRRRCEDLARQRAALAAALGDPRQPARKEEEADQEQDPGWPPEPTLEEETERFRGEVDRMLGKRKESEDRGGE